MRRRGRALSAEERRVWAEVARTIAPLAGRPPAALEPPPVEARPAHPEPGPGPEPPRPKARVASALPTPAPLDRRLARALARGREAPDAKLDLHGMTQAEAYSRLLGFLRYAQMSGQRIVLVVTGHGGSSTGGERGVLRRMVPHWLSLPELRPVVSGFGEAGRRQGGAGALHVRIRRPAARD